MTARRNENSQAVVSALGRALKSGSHPLTVCRKSRTPTRASAQNRRYPPQEQAVVLWDGLTQQSKGQRRKDQREQNGEREILKAFPLSARRAGYEYSAGQKVEEEKQNTK